MSFHTLKGDGRAHASFARRQIITATTLLTLLVSSTALCSSKAHAASSDVQTTTASSSLKTSAEHLESTEDENIVVLGSRVRQTTDHDAADLLKNTLGYSTYSAGGVSALPVMNGMADDRLATTIDGMRIPSACPNHMNPAMSYIDPDMISEVVAIPGITPVSVGGDSIGGTIEVKRRDPQFAAPGKILVTGRATGTYRSNGGASGASGSVTVANDMFSLRWSGSYAHASNYHTGGSNSRQVRSTSYLSFNQAITAGFRKDNHQFTVTVGQQDIPYEGFANQYMDMTNNRSTFVNGKYTGDFDWGMLEVRGSWQRVDHVMNMMNDKGGHTPTTGMPMNTDARNVSYSIKATIPLGRKHTLKVGNSFDYNGLNDWWPPLQGSMMMGPNTFHNINNGHRNVLGQFIEWDAQWTPTFSTQLGFRNDIVMMNTGTVSPYSWTGMMNMSDAMSAQAFNAAQRGRTDINFDVTATGKWQPLETFSIEGGYARKTRSPNIYERYAWGTGNMTTSMVNWFGDGNGYTGNLNLRPEIANTVSFTLDAHDANHRSWSVKIQPFYTYTHNYINVYRTGSLSNNLSKLTFANHNAQSYGINANASKRLWDTPSWGRGELIANINWVRGQDKVTHSGLYHQMPANGRISLHETWENWSGYAEVTLVKSKNTVDWIRNEPRTPGYALFGIGGSYRWRMLTLNASIDNLLDQKYYLPLGGLSIGDYKAGITDMLGALHGMGRSFNMSLSATF
ncbi:MAG: TonB-dependent receptor plug domain-containing protein [Acetobacter sp.]|jgi:iron complex outermembrane receptor protein|nr:TonB-dependent receptor plug domain-containing protein [Acetobacter sp.]MCH4060943.1 TonB-dependent receptor plug domain-containing protein [Acetobacter sp.]MCH4087883.1 TonB-dependent receptor plug domain-containing protein [Acetobacter sp.]MCI1293501.1 TonB-dependent receptor plug domain-containing protein [Acetobacter sp.]MCI1319785.1 TonB-dependent receptor plug domain-containing protein [Acetobacter sp.]